MIFKRKPAPAREAARTSARTFVCVDGVRAEVLDAGDDGWTQLQLPDGTTPTVLASRTSPCTCGGNGCPR